MFCGVNLKFVVFFVNYLPIPLQSKKSKIKMPSLVKKWQSIQKELDEEEKSSSSDEDRDQLAKKGIEDWKQQQLLTYGYVWVDLKIKFWWYKDWSCAVPLSDLVTFNVSCLMNLQGESIKECQLWGRTWRLAWSTKEAEADKQYIISDLCKVI